MNTAELQVENGNFTRIVNPLIDNLIKIPFKGCELAVALFIIRKTYGYNKTEDQISLSQICEGIEKTKPSVVLALKNLQLVKVAKLVKQGNSKLSSNIWKINKYIDTWELVKVAKLVKHKHATSNAKRFKLVKTAKHTKDNIQKTYTKDILTTNVVRENLKNTNYFLSLFKDINPSYERLFPQKGQRDSIDRMVKKYGEDKVERMIQSLPDILSRKYAPTITTPYQLETKLGELLMFIKKEKNGNSNIAFEDHGESI